MTIYLVIFLPEICKWLWLTLDCSSPSSLLSLCLDLMTKLACVIFALLILKCCAQTTTRYRGENPEVSQFEFSQSG